MAGKRSNVAETMGKLQEGEVALMKEHTVARVIPYVGVSTPKSTQHRQALM